MKKICIEVNFFKDEELIMKCPFCEQIIQNDEITSNGNELEINACPHTLFWAIDGIIEFQTPFFDKILIENTDNENDEENYDLVRKEDDEKIFLEGGYLDLEKNDNIIIYEISDSSISPFQSYTIFHYGFMNDEPKLVE